MKGNVELLSESRIILGQIVPVMSSDGYVCITGVVESMNEKRASKGLHKRKIGDVISTDSFKERCYEICSKLEDRKLLMLKEKDLRDKILGLKSVMDLRRLGLAYRKGKGDTQRWFINPYLFVMIAMELDPEIYADVVMWLYDGFIRDRNEAGDAYIRMSSAIRSVSKCGNSEFRDMIRGVAKAINFIVFNKHYDGIRNYASKKEISDIVVLENHIIECIDDGYIKNYDDLVTMLRNKWKKKWGNPINQVMKLDK